MSIYAFTNNFAFVRQQNTNRQLLFFSIFQAFTHQYQTIGWYLWAYNWQRHITIIF